jgi:hypothetical protein
MYYVPGTAMAQTCVRGAALMYEYLEANRLPFERGEAEHLALLFKRIWQPELKVPLLAWAGELQKPLLTETRSH